MKTLVQSFALLLLVLGTSRLASAQNIPNNGFENWATTNTVEAPVNWQTTDNILAAINHAPAGSYYNTGTVTKVTDAHSGLYAAKLTSQSLPTNSGGSVVLPGYLVLGNRVTTDAQYNFYGACRTRPGPPRCSFTTSLRAPAQLPTRQPFR
ncbi:hypothetical protein [Hymenobacter sp. BRD67]|uniref:hypothetical protein n=1 Tax=Hymenobacter sp. BRD67 TaxID=2675877 RepID=UPI001562F6B5|nr:hypothetical protein [Hymenobacter sp. BRD67]QKG54551.1 hypothetical protein GKZ67_20580 [Hymenobacter sp. BRD67]